jgi:hypothetical protein
VVSRSTPRPVSICEPKKVMEEMKSLFREENRILTICWAESGASVLYLSLR